MQRNNNHIIVIGIVLILLMLTYNMAIASGGVQEEAGIWAWLSTSNNSAAVQAIGSIMQVIAAFLTFLAMLYLGYKQNKISNQQNRLTEEQKEMTRRQINLSLYKKRYEIYMELLKLLNQFGSIDICFVEYEKNYQWKEYQSRVRKECACFDRKIKQTEFLFNDELVSYIEDVETMVSELASISDNAGITAMAERSQKIRDEIIIVKNRFKPYLDFKNI